MTIRKVEGAPFIVVECPSGLISYNLALMVGDDSKVATFNKAIEVGAQAMMEFLEKHYLK